MKRTIYVCFLSFLLFGCTSDNHTKSIEENEKKEIEMAKIIQKDTMQIQIKDTLFDVTLEDNQTVAEFLEQLPCTLMMQDLNGNEKYHYLEKPLTSNPQRVNIIQAGELMLFNEDCLVLFYQNFSTTYTYTKIGQLDDIKHLADTMKDRNVEVIFMNK